MTPQEYCKRLSKALAPMPKEERTETVRHYAEFLADANEADRLALGSPEELAGRLLEESGIAPKPERSHRGAIIAILASTFYIWVPLVAVVYVLYLCAILCVAAIWIALAGSMVVCLIAGGFELTRDVPMGLAAIGIGLICGGVGIATLPLCGKAIRAVAGATVWSSKKLWQLISGKKPTQSQQAPTNPIPTPEQEVQ